jgi:hypothetical protein
MNTATMCFQSGANPDKAPAGDKQAVSAECAACACDMCGRTLEGINKCGCGCVCINCRNTAYSTVVCEYSCASCAVCGYCYLARLFCNEAAWLMVSHQGWPGLTLCCLTPLWIPQPPLGTPHSNMSRLVRLFSREQSSARPVLRPNATALQRKHVVPLLLPCTTCPSCCLAGLSSNEQPQQDGLLPSHPYSVQQINAHLLPCGPAQL